MENASLTFSFFLIFSGAALFASVALMTRQPLLIAYIALGALIGPYGTGWVTDLDLMSEISKIGIIFLLFLLGLDMQPKALVATLRNSTLVAIGSSVVFCAAGFGVGLLFGFSPAECAIIGAAMMFSSTIIGIKLLPTTVLHHKHAGDLMVGLLLLQDLIAIFVLLILLNSAKGFDAHAMGRTLLALPALVIATFALVKYVFLWLIAKFDRFHEYIFLMAIGWCLGVAEFAHWLGLSAEIGAFLAGISIATSPIAQYIATSLKPLRDFFLILFFFSLGARFDFGLLQAIAIPAVVLAALMLALKPVVFRYMLGGLSESPQLAWDIGFRLGQVSEFSLLIAYLAASQALIGDKASTLIQATAILTFLASSYIVVLNYPTPIAISDRLRRD